MSDIVGWTSVSFYWSMAFKATINDIIQSQVIAHVRYIKMLTGSEAFWSFFYIWLGFLCAQVFFGNCETLES